jgi:hypothetical protein
MSIKERILGVLLGNAAVNSVNHDASGDGDVFEKKQEQQVPSLQRVIDGIKAIHQETQDSFTGTFAFETVPVVAAGRSSHNQNRRQKDSEYAGYGPKRSNYLRRRTIIKQKEQ